METPTQTLTEVVLQALANHKDDLEELQAVSNEYAQLIELLHNTELEHNEEVHLRIQELDTRLLDLTSAVENFHIPTPVHTTKTEVVETIVKEVRGLKGDSGRGIADIRTEGNILTVIYTDGTTTKLPIPEREVRVENVVNNYHTKSIIERVKTKAAAKQLPKKLVEQVPRTKVVYKQQHPFLRNVIDVEAVTPTHNDVLSYDASLSKWVSKAQSGGSGSSQTLDLELMFKQSELSSYKEFIYSGDTLIGVDLFTDSGKTTKLFTKTLSYVAGDVTLIRITDEVSGAVLEKSFQYTNGILTSSSSNITL